jgi:hypothetical protein
MPRARVPSIKLAEAEADAAAVAAAAAEQQPVVKRKRKRKKKGEMLANKQAQLLAQQQESGRGLDDDNVSIASILDRSKGEKSSAANDEEPPMKKKYKKKKKEKVRNLAYFPDIIYTFDRRLSLISILNIVYFRLNILGGNGSSGSGCFGCRAGGQKEKEFDH